MNNLLKILIFVFVSSPLTDAQILKGRITNEKGDPIPYSTVYIQELRQGTTSNTKGYYEIRLAEGKYTIIYQSLGYEPVLVNLTIRDDAITKDVRLPLQYYQIPEVRITASGEDPAYGIMRKAIGLAPYYLNNISSYEASVYLKGNLVIDKIPILLRRSMKIRSNKESGAPGVKKTIREGDAFVMESYNEIEFTSPDRYIQKVVSYNSTFPEQGNEFSPMEYISASFYQPVIGNLAISPLAPNAFSHYSFKYLGASAQGLFLINKIEVIPKRKSQQLFKGTIYIIEDLWCLQSVDLVNENLIGKVRIQQLYIPVENDIWMPVSDQFEIKIGVMGFKADAGYAASVKYDKVKPNTTLQKPIILSSAFTGKEKTAGPLIDTAKTKAKKQIDKILSKEEMSNRDMVKLSRLMEKEAVKSIRDSSNNLEIKEKTTHIIEKDANRKDSSYWAEIRPIPLSDAEMRSIRVSDSLKAASSLRESRADTSSKARTNEKNGFFTIIRNIVLSHTWSDTSGFSFTNGGLINLKNMTFNTVDGFAYGVDFRFSQSWRRNRSLSVYPDIRWAFSRKQLLWKINSSYRFNGMKPEEVFIRTGMTSRDIGNGGGINPLINSLTSLLLEQNYLKLYQSDYITLGYKSELSNGLTLELTSTFERRKVLQNTTDFTLINSSRTYSENIPDNIYLAPVTDNIHALRNQDHTAITADITYIPYQKYRIEKGRKVPMGSGWPTFNLSWEHGINGFRDSGEKVTHYDMIRAEIYKNQDIGAFSEFRWRFRMGGFLDNRNLSFYDFFHFNPQPFPVLINDYQDAFMLPPFYSMSTPELFGELHVKYTSPYLLLKLLPGLSNTLIRENLTLSYLGSRYNLNYTEIGYSLSEIFFLAEVGVYAGFEDVRYKSIGVKLILRFK